MIILVDKKAFDKVQYNLWEKNKTLSTVGKKQTFLSLIKDVYENLQFTWYLRLNAFVFKFWWDFDSQ